MVCPCQVVACSSQYVVVLNSTVDSIVYSQLFQGKGYPDVATRHLVKSLADALPRT